MSGNFQLKSRFGQGTRAEFTLPLNRPCDLTELTEEEPLGTSVEDEPASHRVLLAEDNAINRLSTRKDLENLGHKVSEAKNGAKALDLLDKEEFDIVLMDIQMPVMDGVECTRRIRRGETHAPPDIPIVTLTGYAMEQEREQFLRAGMDGLVSKPIRLSQLTREMKRVISTRS
jgi:CheY-like chemotaxis protein